MTIRPTERLLPGEGEELIRRCLEDQAIARDRDPEGRAGASRAEMSRALMVSEERVRRMISSDEPTVNLRAGQILALPPRVRRAVLAVLTAESLRLDEGATGRRRSPESMLRQVGAKVGKLNAVVDRALADDEIDEGEAAEIRAAFGDVASEAGAGAAGSER